MNKIIDRGGRVKIFTIPSKKISYYQINATFLVL
jgi:hypothetical protein